MNQINRLGPGKKTNVWLYVAVEEGEEEKVKNTKKTCKLYRPQSTTSLQIPERYD